MLAKVVAFKNRTDITCKVAIDEKNFLPEFNTQDKKNSCSGGFIMYAKKNLIVCSQTIDDRMALVFAQAIPQIRSMLFPSLVKNKAKKVAKETKAHH